MYASLKLHFKTLNLDLDPKFHPHLGLLPAVYDVRRKIKKRKIHDGKIPPFVGEGIIILRHPERCFSA
ncbi:MAG TPA: hypothetical protein DCY12_04700 [Candidatus Atribacteria bacterium]|nr:hypothetical protein [Candidatus Atribacteria bacterium]HCU22381.1 hypothetical protein [Candidatus Atribacteria bacterium]